ncbi:hypothetical protein [Variovorax sp. GT1P44]|uniref:hypothetical protein n=1 Tax=Variovorax sp. GT1P44 TaxID=3443742 RepID=UPI003F487D19
MTRFRTQAAICCAALVTSVGALAQSAYDPDAATQRYNRAVAYCNSGNLPRPARDACIRDAGRAMDQSQGGVAPTIDVQSPGGRATVVIPDNAPLPRSDSTTITSPDGDSTIVLPADGSRPISQ